MFSLSLPAIADFDRLTIARFFQDGSFVVTLSPGNYLIIKVSERHRVSPNNKSSTAHKGSGFKPGSMELECSLA
ncbi:hypothetical protein H6H01_17645 [Nostoc calcicola FACHB-3891]|nr:hypothetical protein [Nostoc calcicola FACHB-3891]